MGNEVQTVEVNRKYIKHIGDNFGRSYIRSIIEGGRSLDGDVEDFYGISGINNCSGAECKSYEEMTNTGKDSTGKTPSDLIELLEPFDSEGIDVSKLKYEDVRSDHKKWNSRWRKTQGFVGGALGGVCIAAGGIATVVSVYANYSDSITLSEGILPTAIVATLVGLGLFYNTVRKPKETNNEINEFEKLRHAGKDANAFIRKEYRDYLVQEALTE